MAYCSGRMLIRSDWVNILDGEGNTTISQSLKDRTGKAMPTRFARGYQVDETISFHQSLAERTEPLREHGDNRIGNQCRRRRCADLVGDHAQFFTRKPL